MSRNPEPLVSIISFCKDRASTIRRSIDSVLSQSYGNLEFVVQDGASTDGTLDILRSYDDPRIKLVSHPDSGPAEAFWTVLRRCEGELIGTCLSDEELLPGAIEQAVAMFREHPEIGAATCDGHITDKHGTIKGPFTAGEFNFVNYLFGRYCPFWPGSFFRRSALEAVGLWTEDDWSIGALEFEIWVRLATRHRVKSFAVPMSKYTIDDTQLSQTAKAFNEHMDNRIRIVEHIFSDRGFAGRDDEKKLACLYNQRYLFYNHVRAYKMHDQMEMMYRQIVPVLDMAGNAGWVTAVAGDNTPGGLQPFPIPESYYDHFDRLLEARTR